MYFLKDATIIVKEAEDIEEKQRYIQEYVPGKQVTLAHIIPHPSKDIFKKLGLTEVQQEAIGILTITPSEASIIAADVAIKAAGIIIGFIDRFSGSLVITGDVSSVEASMKDVLDTLTTVLAFSSCKITKS